MISMIPLSNLTASGRFLLVTDELPSPADFFLHQSLISHLKERKDSKCVILSVSDALSRWKAIASKQNVNISQHVDSGSLLFIDVLSEVQPSSPPHPPNDSGQASQIPELRPLFDLVVSSLTSLNSESNQTLVILDDISALEWIGFSFLDLTRFSRALRSLCLKRNASLVIRHHFVGGDEPDELFFHLLKICWFHLDVRPLVSGKSGAVSGEVALHAGATHADPKIRLIPRSQAIQYRLTDTGAIFFERGTGAGVL